MVKVNLAITYRKNTKKVDRASVTDTDYNVCLDKLKDNGVEVISKYFETDSKGRYHLHMLALADTKVKYTNLKVQGYSSKCLRCWDTKGWLNYIRKDVKYAEEIARDLTQSIMAKDYDAQLGSERPPDKKLAVEAPGEEPEQDLLVQTPKEERIKITTKKLF